MKCPIMYEPGKWGLVEVPEADLKRPTITLAFRTNDEQVKVGAPRSLSSMIAYETRTFQKLELMKSDVLYNVYV